MIPSAFRQFFETILLKIYKNNEQYQQKENKEKESMRKKSSASKLFFDLPGANAA